MFTKKYRFAGGSGCVPEIGSDFEFPGAGYTDIFALPNRRRTGGGRPGAAAGCPKGSARWEQRGARRSGERQGQGRSRL